jgi:hypothetical protein
VLTALGAGEDDLVDVGERHVRVAVVEERGRRDLLGRGRELGAHVLLLEEPELLRDERGIEQQRGRRRLGVDDLDGLLPAAGPAARPLVVAAAARDRHDPGHHHGHERPPEAEHDSPPPRVAVA